MENINQHLNLFIIASEAKLPNLCKLTSLEKPNSLWETAESPSCKKKKKKKCREKCLHRLLILSHTLLFAF